MPDYESTADPYLDRDSGLLRNKLAITDKATLERVESVNASDAGVRWQADPKASSFDLKHLQAVHQQLFGKTYDWAGELRSVPIGKGGSLFALPQYIESALKPVFKDLAKERETLAQATPEKFAQRAAYYMGEINAVHPFREGNGRSQREFVEQLARESGHHFRWESLDKQDMTAASIASMHGETGPMERLLINSIAPYGKEGMTMATPMAINPNRLESTNERSWQQEQIETNQALADRFAQVGPPSLRNNPQTKEQASELADQERTQKKTGITNDQLSQNVTAGSLVLEDAIPPAKSGELASAIEADRTKLDLMERSYAKDHPEQAAIGRARIFVRAVEMANQENRKTLDLEERQVKAITPKNLQSTQRRALEMSEKTLNAAGSKGIHVQHELKEEWSHRELRHEYSNGGMEHGE